MAQVHGPVFPKMGGCEAAPETLSQAQAVFLEGVPSIVTSLWDENEDPGTRTSLFVGPHRKSCLMTPFLRGKKMKIIPAPLDPRVGWGKREHILTSGSRDKAFSKDSGL